MKKRNFRNKSLSVLSTAVLLGAMTPHVSAATTLSDIPNNYAKQAILELVEKGIMNGTGNGKFNPASNISRQDFAIVLARSLNLDLSTPPATATFKDIPKDHYAYAAVEAAVKAGLVKGTGGGQFGTGQNLTREQMAVIFVNALGVDSTGKGKDLKFSDAASIASWAKDAVATAVEFGLMAGNPDGTFSPSNSASRQDLALVASKFLTEKVKVDEQHKAEQESSKPTAPVETKPPVVTPTPSPSPSPTPPVIVTPVPTPGQPDTTPLLQGVEITNLLNETYYKQDVTPYSAHSDIKKVELWKAAYGAFGRSPEEVKVENYTLGTKLSEEASYHLTVTDNKDHVVETWFSIDKTSPSLLGDIYESQKSAGDQYTYDAGDYIMIAFNRSIQKFDTADIVNAAASESLPEVYPGLSVKAIEEALKEKSTDFTLGDGASLITQNSMDTIKNVPYGNIFRLVLGEGANIPAGGLTINLDSSKIVGPSGLKPSNPFTLTIPSIPVNHAPSVSNVTITGVNEAGKTLTGSYDFSDGDLGDLEGETTYKWYRVDNDGVNHKEEIVDAVGKTYTLTAADSGHKIIFEVTPFDSRGKAGLPMGGLTDTDVTDPAPTISDLNEIGLSANTPDTQLYLKQSVIPTSPDSDIMDVKLSRTTDTGLNYYNHTYDVEVTGYEFGDSITENGSYELAVTDNGGHTTKSYFTIDTLMPALSTEEPVTQQQIGNNSSIYDTSDSIWINFNDPIKKYTVMDDQEIEGLDTDNVFTMEQLESALNSIDSSYTFGDGAMLFTTSTDGIYIGDGSYAKEFQIILGDNANIPATGVTISLPTSIISGPTGIHSAESISVDIPAISGSSNEGPAIPGGE